MIATITPQELFKLREADPAIKILDVRTPAEFEGVHAESAYNIPLDQLDPNSAMASRNGAGDRQLYVICKMGGRSQKACEQFVAAGFKNVVNITGGTDAWVAKGLPVVEGEHKVMALDRQVRILAGSLVLLGAVLAIFAQPYWAWLSAFIGAGLVFSGVTDTCGMGTVLAKMPWNQVRKKSQSAAPVCDDGG